MAYSQTTRFMSTVLASLALALPTLAHAELSKPGEVLTVMQFSAKSVATSVELKKRMLAMRDFQRQQTGYVENAIFENRNPQAKPQYVGVSRWKSLKDWEGLWTNEQFKKLVASIGEVGEINPGVYSPVE